MELFLLAQAELLRSNVDRKHPFNYFWVTTLDYFPEVRTVVLRKAEDDFRLTFFTDSRSPKVEHIQRNPRVSALFYHPRKKLQLRIKGEAKVWTSSGEKHREFKRRVEQSGSLKDYTTNQAPGTPLREEGLPESGTEIYFAVVEIESILLDILQLGSENHQRAQYQKENQEWKEQKVVP